MSDISGFDNEYEFVKYLNNKKISQLNPMFRELIDALFEHANEDSIIKCWLNHFKEKSDIFIKINGIMKGISIKKGNKNSVHVERISDFINFLIENKVDKDKETTIEKPQKVNTYLQNKEKARAEARRKKLEKLIEELEKEISAMEENFSNEEVASDYIKVLEIQKQIDEKNVLLEQYTEEWYNLTEKSLN